MFNWSVKVFYVQSPFYGLLCLGYVTQFYVYTMLRRSLQKSVHIQKTFGINYMFLKLFHILERRSEIVLVLKIFVGSSMFRSHSKFIQTCENSSVIQKILEGVLCFEAIFGTFILDIPYKKLRLKNLWQVIEDQKIFGKYTSIQKRFQCFEGISIFC